MILIAEPLLLMLALQVTAETTTPLGRTEIADPMAIEVSLGADEDVRQQPRPPFRDMPVGKARAYPETDRFVCDQARVRMLTVKKLAETDSEVVLEAAATLKSEWPFQDVDFAIELLAPDGALLGRQTWDDITLGAWSRTYTPTKAQFRLPIERWLAMFDRDSAPRIRLVLDIQD